MHPLGCGLNQGQGQGHYILVAYVKQLNNVLWNLQYFVQFMSVSYFVVKQ